MKKTVSYLSAMVLTLARGQIAFAQEEGETAFSKPDWKKDFSVTIGVKVWVNEWQIDRFFDGAVGIPPFTSGAGSLSGLIVVNTRDTGPDTLISEGVEPTPIPQLSVKYKQFFVTGSYYSETEFDFPAFGRSGTADLFDAQGNFLGRLTNRNVVDNTTGERWEWDAAAGWYIHPYVALLVGYKEINIKTNFTSTTTDVFFEDLPSESTQVSPTLTGFNEIEATGPTIGIAGSVPIAHGFGIYASYAHGFMDVDTKDVIVSPQFQESSFDLDADYDVAELGFSYTPNMAALLPHLPLSAATVYAGYRYQTIETDIAEPSGDRKDVTQGFAAGLNLTW